MASFLRKLREPHRLRQQIGGIFFLGLIVSAKSGPIPFEYAFVIPSGAAFFWIGVFGRAWASGYLVKNDALTTSGPYGFVRNPIYVFNLLIGLGLIFLGGRYWTIALLAALYAFCYLPGMRVEEENLRRRYGAAFEAYALAVPRITPRARAVAGYGGGRWTWRAFVDNRETFVTLGLAAGFAVVCFKICAAGAATPSAW